MSRRIGSLVRAPPKCSIILNMGMELRRFVKDNMQPLRMPYEHQREEAGDIFSSLNPVVLLEILAYCDPRSICHLSRTCRWAKQFIDANFHRLPHPELELHIRADANTFTHRIVSFLPYKVLLEVESESCDVQQILSQAKYAFLVSARVFGSCPVSAACCQSLMQNLALANSEMFDLDVEIVAQESPFLCNRIVLQATESDSSAAQYMMDLSHLPLEAIFCDKASIASEQTYEMLTLAFRSPISTRLTLYGVFTVEQCLDLFTKILKDLVSSRELDSYFSVTFIQSTVDSGYVDPSFLQYYLYFQRKMEQLELQKHFDIVEHTSWYLTVRPKSASYETTFSVRYSELDEDDALSVRIMRTSSY